METLKIGDLEARLPVIQGGMGVAISLSRLASAVANEGGSELFHQQVSACCFPVFQRILEEQTDVCCGMRYAKRKR